jgi:hypothetical protein
MEEKKKYKHKTASPAHNRATAKYNATHTKQIGLILNLGTDKDILEHLDKQPSKMGYIKQLIRDDIERGQK